MVTTRVRHHLLALRRHFVSPGAADTLPIGSSSSGDAAPRVHMSQMRSAGSTQQIWPREAVLVQLLVCEDVFGHAGVEFRRCPGLVGFLVPLDTPGAGGAPATRENVQVGDGTVGDRDAACR